MAKSHELNIPAHYNIYNGSNSRNLNIYFSEPENGVNSETGILLLIPGFGGNSQSNVYKKMRSLFADQHNLIVVQCDYFGSEFMQSTNRFNFDFEKYKALFSANLGIKLKNDASAEKLLEELAKYECVVNATEILDESVDNFNDMGFMQALDLLTAVYAVKAVLSDNQLVYNENKIIAYGHSHGAYLSLLCNRIAPNEFTLIIDNSAWIKPVYLESARCLWQKYGKMTMQIEFDYFAQRYHYDKEILDLSVLYKNFDNQAKITAFHGIDDNLVSYSLKREFYKGIKNTEFNLVDEGMVDNKLFFSSSHGLNADF